MLRLWILYESLQNQILHQNHMADNIAAVVPSYRCIKLKTEVLDHSCVKGRCSFNFGTADIKVKTRGLNFYICGIIKETIMPPYTTNNRAVNTARRIRMAAATPPAAAATPAAAAPVVQHNANTYQHAKEGRAAAWVKARAARVARGKGLLNEEEYNEEPAALARAAAKVAKAKAAEEAAAVKAAEEAAEEAADDAEEAAKNAAAAKRQSEIKATLDAETKAARAVEAAEAAKRDAERKAANAVRMANAAKQRANDEAAQKTKRNLNAATARKAYTNAEEARKVDTQKRMNASKLKQEAREAEDKAAAAQRAEELANPGVKAARLAADAAAWEEEFDKKVALDKAKREAESALVAKTRRNVNAAEKKRIAEEEATAIAKSAAATAAVTAEFKASKDAREKAAAEMNVKFQAKQKRENESFAYFKDIANKKRAETDFNKGYVRPGLLSDVYKHRLEDLKQNAIKYKGTVRSLGGRRSRRNRAKKGVHHKTTMKYR